MVFLFVFVFIFFFFTFTSKRILPLKAEAKVLNTFITKYQYLWVFFLKGVNLLK